MCVRLPCSSRVRVMHMGSEHTVGFPVLIRSCADNNRPDRIAVMIACAKGLSTKRATPSPRKAGLGTVVEGKRFSGVVENAVNFGRDSLEYVR